MKYRVQYRNFLKTTVRLFKKNILIPTYCHVYLNNDPLPNLSTSNPSLLIAKPQRSPSPSNTRTARGSHPNVIFQRLHPLAAVVRGEKNCARARQSPTILIISRCTSGHTHKKRGDERGTESKTIAQI